MISAFNPYAGLSDDDDESIEPSTPEQVVRKRRKRGKKKKKKTTSESADANNDDDDDGKRATAALGSSSSIKPDGKAASNTASKIEDPVSAVIKEIVGLGEFSQQEVEACVGQLWDRGLQYDNIDTVIATLRAQDKQGQIGIAGSPKGPDVGDIGAGRCELNEEMGLNGNDGFMHVLSRSTHKKMHPKNAQQVTNINDVPVTMATADRREPVHSASSKPGGIPHEHSSPGAAPLVMNNLEAIVEMQPLCASLEAICKMLSLSDGADLQSLSIPNKSLTATCLQSPALPTLFQRIVLSRDALMGNVSRHVELLLQLLVAGKSSVHGLVQIIQKISSKLGSLSGGQDMMGASEVVAQRIVELLGKCHSVAFSTHSSNADADVPGNGDSSACENEPLGSILTSLDEEVAAVNQAIAEDSHSNAGSGSGSGSVLDLQSSLVLRDMEHDRLDLHLKAVEAAMQRIASAPKSMDAAKIPTKSIQILSSSSDDDDVQIEKRLSAIIKIPNTSTIGASSELTACTKSLSSLIDRQQKLRMELQKIDIEINALQARKASLEGMESDRRPSDLSDKNMQETVSALVENLRQFGSSIASINSVTATPIISGQGTHLDTDKLLATSQFPTRMQSAFASLQKFVLTQSQCMTLLSKRMVITNAKFNHLRSELAIYKELQNSVGIAESCAFIRSLEENIVEDVEALEFLQSDLVNQLTRFSTATACNPDPTAGFSVHGLQGNLHTAVQALRAAGVGVATGLLNSLSSFQEASRVASSVSAASKATSDSDRAVNRGHAEGSTPLTGHESEMVSPLLSTLLQATPSLNNPAPVPKITLSKPSVHKVDRVGSARSLGVSESTAGNSASMNRSSGVGKKETKKSSTLQSGGMSGGVGKAGTANKNGTLGSIKEVKERVNNVPPSTSAEAGPSKSISAFQGWDMIGKKMVSSASESNASSIANSNASSTAHSPSPGKR